MEWKKVNICDMCDSISATYSRGADMVVLINTSDVLNGKFLNRERVPNKDLKGQFKKTFQRDDILYSEIRPANKRFAYVDFDAIDYIASTKLMVLRAKPNVNPRFLYHILKSEDTLEKLQMLAESRSGTFPQITYSEMANVSVLLPDRATQDKIVAILSSLDDKIENNNRINRNLEAQAQALFKSWFVDFEPFGGKMPEDWREGTLGEIAHVTSGKRPPLKQSLCSADINIPLIGAADIMGYTNSVLYTTPILVTGRVGTHGIVQRFNEPCWPSDNTLVVEGKWYEYIYQTMCRIDYHNMNRGSTQPLITQTDLKNQKVIIPNVLILDKFETQVTILYKQVYINQRENVRLAALRDTLLPKLMKGEIEV